MSTWSSALERKFASKPLFQVAGWSSVAAARLLRKDTPANTNIPRPRRARPTPFRMTAAGRTLNDEEVVRLPEEDARKIFEGFRWENGRPSCPKCSSTKCSARASRPGYYRCPRCKIDFSATADTTLQSHKLPLRRIFAAIFYLMVLPYGVSSASLSVLMGISPNTAFVMLHRVRECLAAHILGLKLSGEVEIDGVYFSRSVRRPNIGRRSLGKLRQPSKTGRCVLTLKQRGGPVIPVLVEGETSAAILAAVETFVEPGTRIFTDDLASYRFLKDLFELRRVNHGIQYAVGETHVNGAESFHSRLKKSRTIYGRFISGDDFMLYIYEMAYKHGATGTDTRTLWEDVIGLVASQPVSDRFAGYWQAIRSSIAA